jgi:tetratricopeptide (TPR) repeat protein
VGALKQRGAGAVRALRIAKWVLFLLGCAAAFSPVAVAIAAWRAEARLDEAVQEIVRRGEPVEASQLVRPPISDSENAALVYEEAFDAIELSDEDEELIADLKAERVSLGDPGIASRARAIMDQNAEALESIHGAAGMPRCDFRADWSKGYDVGFPQFAKLRTCARLLAFESLMLLDAGRVDEAADVCGAILRVANAAEEPCTIGQMVRYAINGMGSRALSAVLRESQPDSDLCRRLADEIGRTDLVSSFEEALKGERALGRATFAAVRLAKDPLDGIEDLQAGPPAEPSGASEGGRTERPPKQSYMARWMLASDEAEYLRRMARAMEDLPRPYREARRALEELSYLQVTYLPPPTVVTAMLLPAFDRTFARRDSAIAQLRLAEVALLLKACKGERGEYPESLAELEEFVGRELPADPFSGTSLVYQREGDGFALYSWGTNLQDDSGSPSPPGRPEEGDMVLRCLR